MTFAWDYGLFFFFAVPASASAPEPPRPGLLPLLPTPDWSELLFVLPVPGVAADLSLLVSLEPFMSVVDGCPPLEGLALLPLLV